MSREVAQQPSEDIPPKSIEEVQQVPSGELTSQISPNGDVFVNGIKLEKTDFDYPITINSRVLYWVDYFNGRGRKHFEKYLERSELFIPYIQPLLRQNGMPEDLVYLAMIESGFNNHARSHAKAVGPWQFISATGKRYGLAVNWWVDERRDTRKSTLAAVEYLKDLHNMFQSWELAAAAYNAGEAKIARAIRRYGTRDFWTLSRYRFLRPETRDYVPKIIAAAIISKNRTLFGFPASGIKPAEGEMIAPDGGLVKVEKEDPNAPQPDVAQAESVSDVIAVGEESVVDGEPEEDDASAEPEVAPANLVVPVGLDPSGGQMALARPVQLPHVDRKGELSGEDVAEFEIQGPADLSQIAHAAGLSYHTVKALNPELLRWCTPPGAKTYRIRLPISAKDKFLETYNHEEFPRNVRFLTYKIRKGETLSRVARKFGLKVEPLSDLNGVSANARLKNGSMVLLPLPNDRSRALSSLDVFDPPEKRRYRKTRKSQSRSYKVSYKKREAARSRSTVRRLTNDT